MFNRRSGLVAGAADFTGFSREIIVGQFGCVPHARYRWRIGTVQGAVATWRLVGADFRGRQVATAPCTVPFSEFASSICSGVPPTSDFQLLTSQSDHRIDLRRAPRRYPAGHKGDDG